LTLHQPSDRVTELFLPNPTEGRGVPQRAHL
jgi:hypothetical protein